MEEEREKADSFFVAQVGHKQHQKASTGEYGIYGSPIGGFVKVEQMSVGWARKNKYRTKTKLSPAQKAFLEWAYGYGLRREKFTAVRAEAAMKICGTAAGELKFPGEPMMKDIGKPKFSFFEVVEHWEMTFFFLELGKRR